MGLNIPGSRRPCGVDVLVFELVVEHSFQERVLSVQSLWGPYTLSNAAVRSPDNPDRAGISTVPDWDQSISGDILYRA